MIVLNDEVSIDNGISRIFSLPFFKYTVDNYKSFNSKILSCDFIVNNQLKRSRKFEGNFLSSFDKHDLESAEWSSELFSFLTDAMTLFLKQLLKNSDPVDYQFSLDFSAPWINYYKKGHYQEVHNHLPSHFSYCYYVKLPVNSGDTIFINSDHTYNSLIPFKTTANRFIPLINEGDLIIFPSYLNHYVTDNKSDESRITIAGNIKIEEL